MRLKSATPLRSLRCLQKSKLILNLSSFSQQHSCVFHPSPVNTDQKNRVYSASRTKPWNNFIHLSLAISNLYNLLIPVWFSISDYYVYGCGTSDESYNSYGESAFIFLSWTVIVNLLHLICLPFLWSLWDQFNNNNPRMSELLRNPQKWAIKE